MTKLSFPTAAREQVMAALEASAAAVRALDAVAAIPMASEDAQQEWQDHVEKAAELLRQSIRELRLTEDAEPLLGATGFVMAVRRRREAGAPPGEPPASA